MNKDIFNERVKRLQEVDKIIKSLDPSIRGLSFELLRNYIVDSKSSDGGNNGGENHFENSEEFFTKFNHDKPSDNVMLIAAFYYNEYGIAGLSMDELKEIANNVGVTIPNRPDMTLKNAQKDGKSLFNPVGRGIFKPTVHGEKFLKDTYNVSKGNKKKEEDKS